MIASAQTYVQRRIDLPLTIGGAGYQHGSGRSGVLAIGDKSYLTGNQAAHYGIGTVYRGGQPLSEYVERQVRALREKLRLPDGEPGPQLDANADLARRGLAYDAMTYYAPAFVNQSDGVIEKALQRVLKRYLPVVVPATNEELELSLTASAYHFCETFPKAMAKEAGLRLDKIQRGEASAFTQHPTDVANLIYEGSEPRYLETLRDKLLDPSSDLQEELESWARSISEQSREYAELAEAGREGLATANPRTSAATGVFEGGTGPRFPGGK